MEISVARKRLEEMRADLDRTVSILMGEHHLVRGGGAEPGDAGANLTEADRNAAGVDSAPAQRAEVMAALARIDDGSYGRCVDCSGPVPELRLEARPATARCVPCQAKRDRRRRLSSLGAGSDQLGTDRVIGTGVQLRVDQLGEA
ncbi:MAG: TraR/DksA family transcriptional regulator [Trebonia sp.]